MTPSPPLPGVRSPLLVVLSAVDPVAATVGELWGNLPATGDHVDGAPVRSLDREILVLRRPGPHIHDERLDSLLPPSLRASRPTVAFPSIHRSERSVPCLTVHPLGNPGPRAEVGGAPRQLVPTDPPRMAAALRGLAELAERLGVPVSYEATHHGPALELPAFFAEVGETVDPGVARDAARAVGETLRDLVVESTDRPALAVGGGHYAPRFTDLALGRRWAFGHILSRYALAEMAEATARDALEGTPGAEGVLFARAEDANAAPVRALAPRLRESDAPRRTAPTGSTRDDPAASGT
jgi:D-tyrosyl-tRNA(Tyr) deacylase